MLDLESKKEKIKETCERNNVKLLILHGSHSQNRAHANSDIDVGILFDEKIKKMEYLKILSDFQDIFGDKLDTAFLNNTEPMINYQIALKGKLLYEGIKGDFSNYIIESIGKYNDSKKFRELEKLYIKKAVGAA